MNLAIHMNKVAVYPDSGSVITKSYTRKVSESHAERQMHKKVSHEEAQGYLDADGTHHEDHAHLNTEEYHDQMVNANKE